MLTGNPAVVT